MNRRDLDKVLRESTKPDDEIVDFRGIPLVYSYPLGNGKTVLSATKPDGIHLECKGPVFHNGQAYLANTYSCPTCDKNVKYTEIQVRKY